MRNLKKILALVLALVMSMSLLATANAFNDDAEIDPTYDEAVTVLANLGVFQGYNNGETFVPKGSITRAEVAAILYRIATGDVDNTQVSLYADYNTFNDVKSTSWYAGYVNYCANAEYIKGYDDKTFGPNDPVTGYQALAMILRAVGYDANDEFTGTSWQVKVASTANQLGITRNISAGTLGTAATREVVAEILFRTIAEAYIVEYTTAFGYQPIYLPTSSTNNGSAGNLSGNIALATLGFRTFGLEMTEGEITAVGRTAKTTTIIQDSVAANDTQINPVTVTGTDTPWTNIGYAAYVYTVPTTGAKTREAVSDVVITGESLGVTTAGTTAWGNLFTSGNDEFIAGRNDFVNGRFDASEEFHVYYNGVLAWSTADGGWTNNRAAVAGAQKWVNNPSTPIARGVKIDFIDNDDGGLAEVVSITEYTTAQITGITTANATTGANATAASTVYYTTTTATGTTTTTELVANVVSDTELAVGDIVTYVDYQGTDPANTRYTTVSPVTAGQDFTQVARDKANDIYYVIGGQNLYTSEITPAAWIAYLTAGNTGTKVDYYLDPYGYVILANKTATVSQYVLGVSNDHTVGTTGLANSWVVASDGSVNNVSIASIDTVITDLANNAIREKMYSYTSSISHLTTANTQINTIDYTSGRSNITLNGAAYYVNSQTVVIDVTDVLTKGVTASTTVYTGHVGDSKIPSMDDAEGWFVADNTGYVSLMFVWDIDTDKADHFLVYSIDQSIRSQGNNYATMDVIRDGALDTVTLPIAEYYKIALPGQGHGVGVYDSYTAANGETYLTGYTSFSEIWNRLTWANNTVVVRDETTNNLLTSYSYDSNTTFTVIDVTNDTYGIFDMVYGRNYLLNASNYSLGFVEASGNLAKHIYVVVGVEATDATDTWKLTQNNSDGSTTTYYVADDLVTGVVTTATEKHNIYIDDIFYASVESGKTINLPDGTVGTGYDLDGVYYAYTSTYTVPVLKNNGDIKFESGYVAWTLKDGDTDADGKPVDVTVPVEYAMSGKVLNTVFNTQLTGSYSYYTRTNGGSGWVDNDGYVVVGTGAGTTALYPNDDAVFTAGYYKVTVTNTSAVTVTVDDVTVTDYLTIGSDSGFFVTADQVVAVKNNTTQEVTYYGGVKGAPITNDISI